MLQQEFGFSLSHNNLVADLKFVRKKFMKKLLMEDYWQLSPIST